MLTFTLEFPIGMLLFMFFTTAIIAGFFGYGLRSKQLARKNREINKLEKEMVHTHAEILETQKQYCELESRYRDLVNPVIAMKHAGKEEGESEQHPDASSLRKNRPTRTA